MSVDLSSEMTFHTIKDVARRWNVSTKTVRRLIDRKKMAIHHIGGQIRISQEDLLVFEGHHRE
jgi:excisionase family DNA binding protein